MKVKCPTCAREIDWANAPFRPFCTERCRLIDLGAWLAAKHAIPGEPVADQSNPPPEGSPESEHH